MLPVDEDFEMPPVPPMPPRVDLDNDRVRIQSFHWDESDKEEMKKAMNKLRAEMKDMEKESGEMNFEMFRGFGFRRALFSRMDDADFFPPESGHERSVQKKFRPLYPGGWRQCVR